MFKKLKNWAKIGILSAGISIAGQGIVNANPNVRTPNINQNLVQLNQFYLEKQVLLKKKDNYLINAVKQSPNIYSVVERSRTVTSVGDILIYFEVINLQTNISRYSGAILNSKLAGKILDLTLFSDSELLQIALNFQIPLSTKLIVEFNKSNLFFGSKDFQNLSIVTSFLNSLNKVGYSPKLFLEMAMFKGNSYENFKFILKETIVNLRIKDKIKFENNFLIALNTFLYSNYDNKVKFGHNNKINLEVIYNQIKNGNNSGNCGDYSVILLDIAKTVLGTEGFVLHEGAHMLPIFSMNGGYFTPDDNFQYNRFSKNLYHLLDHSNFQVVSNFISTANNTIIAELQSYFQKKFEKKVSPFGISSYKDIPIQKIESKGLEVYQIGVDNREISGIKSTFSNKYLDNKLISGTFATSFNIAKITDYKQSKNAKPDIDLFNISSFNNLGIRLDKNGDFILGNFTRALVSISASSLFNRNNLLFSSSSNSIGGDDLRLDSSFYFLGKINDRLKVMVSTGVIFQTADVRAQKIKGHSITTYGIKYISDWVNISYFEEILGKMNKHTIDMGIKRGDFYLEGNVSYLRINDKFLSNILPKFQKQLKLTFGGFKNGQVSLRLVEEGRNNKKIEGNIKFEF